MVLLIFLFVVQSLLLSSEIGLVRQASPRRNSESATALARICRGIEQAIEEAEETDDLLIELAAEFERVRAILESERDRERPTD